MYICREGDGTPLQYSRLENPMEGGAWWAAVHGVAKSRTLLNDFTFTLHFGEGNGNPLQCSCLENPRDGGAWWAAVYGVAQSRTRLRRLSSSSCSSVYTSIPISQGIPPTFRPWYPYASLYVRVSISALQTGSSVPLFWTPHICVHI